MIVLSLQQIFDFTKKEFTKDEINVILGMLTSEEKEIFNILKLKDNALTATETYNLYVEKLMKNSKLDKEEFKDLQDEYPERRPSELMQKFIRENDIKVPTNRTITRVLDNMKDAGFILRRKSTNKKAKAFYCIHPKLKLELQKMDKDMQKKMNVAEMKQQLRQIKEFLAQQKK